MILPCSGRRKSRGTVAATVRVYRLVQEIPNPPVVRSLSLCTLSSEVNAIAAVTTKCRVVGCRILSHVQRLEALRLAEFGRSPPRRMSPEHGSSCLGERPTFAGQYRDQLRESPMQASPSIVGGIP